MAACLLLTSGPAHAATTFAVDRNDDPDPTTAKACTDTTPNDCSLRGAIVAANAGADTITVPASATPYTLSRAGSGEDAASTGDLDITDELTITGAGARTTSVAGGAAPFDDRVFENRPGRQGYHNRWQSGRQRRRLQPGQPDARKGGRQEQHRPPAWRYPRQGGHAQPHQQHRIW